MSGYHSDTDNESIFSAHTTSTARTEWSAAESDRESDAASVLSSMCVLRPELDGDETDQRRRFEHSTYSITSSVLNYHYEVGCIELWVVFGGLQADRISRTVVDIMPTMRANT